MLVAADCWLLTAAVSTPGCYLSPTIRQEGLNLCSTKLTKLNIYSPKLRHFWSTSLLKIQELALVGVVVVVVLVVSLGNKLGDFNAVVISQERLRGVYCVTTLISLFTSVTCHVSRVIVLVLVHREPAGGVLSLHHPTDDWSCSGSVSHGRGHSTTTTTSGLVWQYWPAQCPLWSQESQDTGQENINQIKNTSGLMPQ